MPVAHAEREYSEAAPHRGDPCSDAAPTTPPIAAVESAVFKGGESLKREGVLLSIGSSVIVMPSHELADRRIRQGRAWRRCALGYRQRSIPQGSTNTVTYGKVLGRQLYVSLPGTYGAYGQRTILTATSMQVGTRRDRCIDDYEFAYGRVVVRLLVIMIPQPFPSDAERLLLASLSKRAKAVS
jgi:hypothetical protein